VDRGRAESSARNSFLIEIPDCGIDINQTAVFSYRENKKTDSILPESVFERN